MSGVAEKAKSNRDQFPETARVLDEMRDVFGPGVQVTFAEEGGVKVGTPSVARRGTWVSMADMVIAKKETEVGKK